MDKTKLISKIKGVIHEWGPFTIAELEGHNAPVYKTSKNGLKSLMEGFKKNGVDLTNYDNGKPTSEDFVHYDELNPQQLDEILYLATEFDTISWKIQERCNDYDY